MNIIFFFADYLYILKDINIFEFNKFLMLRGIVVLLTSFYINQGVMYMYQKAMCIYNYPI